MNDQGKYSDAIKQLLKAIKIDSSGDCGTGTKGKAHAELGYSYLKTGDTQNARIFFDKSILLDPTNPFPRQNMAVMLSMQNKTEDAYKVLGDLIQMRPDYIEAYIQRGFLYRSENKVNLAITDFKKALDLNLKTNILPVKLVNDLNVFLKTGPRD